MKNDELENARVKYQAALSLFTSEGQIQWSRYNAMLVVNTILFGLISLKDFTFPDFFQFLFRLLPIFGLILCYSWHRMTERGFVWMNHWISEANKLEKQLGGQLNPIQSGDELRFKVGTNVIKNDSLLIIKIIALLYLFMTIVNVGPLIITQK